MAVRSGLKTLVEMVSALEALHNQLLNLQGDQAIERYGVMVPRFAAAPGTIHKDVLELEKKIYGRRFAQDVRVVDAIKVVRELIKEHEMSTSVPASELENPNG